MATLYRERQKFNQWWIWLLLFFSVGMSAAAGWIDYVENGSWVGLIAGLVVVLCILIPMALVELRTEIKKDGIEVGFWPFSRRRIFRSEIAEARVRKYSPIGEYGGWGFRSGSQGLAYNTGGNMGLQLRLRDGKRLLIGTQRPEELETFISAYLAEDQLDLLELEALQAEKSKLLRGR